MLILDDKHQSILTLKFALQFTLSNILFTVLCFPKASLGERWGKGERGRERGRIDAWRDTQIG